MPTTTDDRALTELRAAVANLANATARLVNALDVLERCGCHCAACTDVAANTDEQGAVTADKVPPKPQTLCAHCGESLPPITERMRICRACDGFVHVHECAPCPTNSEEPPRDVPGARPVASMGYWEVFG